MPPHYPLTDVKRLLKANHYQINPNALQSAHLDFRWGGIEMAKCLLRLNNKPHAMNANKNHFHKHAPSETVPGVELDFYKIRNAPEGNKVYTHLYIRAQDGKLIINSFKELS